MGRRNDIDWDAIRRDYRLGSTTDAELCRRYGVSKSALRKQRIKGEWTHDLREEVRHATQAALLTGREPSITSKDVDGIAVNIAAQENVKIIKRHREVADKLMSLAENLHLEIDALTGKPVQLKALVDAVVQGQPDAYRSLQDVLTVHQRIASLGKLASSVATIISTEREAHNLNDTGDGKETIEAVLARIRARKEAKT